MGMSKENSRTRRPSIGISTRFISEPLEQRRLMAAFLPPLAQVPNLDSVNFVGSNGTGTLTASSSGTFFDFQTLTHDYDASSGDFALNVSIQSGSASGTLDLSGQVADMDGNAMPSQSIALASITKLTYNAAIHSFEFNGISTGTAILQPGLAVTGIVVLPANAGANLLATSFSFSGPIDPLDAEVGAALIGDANGDGVVSTGDFTALAAHFGQTGTARSSGDFNADGTTNALDFNALATDFGSKLNSPAGATALALPSHGNASLFPGGTDKAAAAGFLRSLFNEEQNVQ
jgi:hypothetical protein